MPHNRLRDPQTPSGDAEALRETACACVEEFVRMGHDAPAILRMFQNPFYTTAHQTYRALGHAVSAAIIDRCLATGRRSRRFDGAAAGRPSIRGRIA